MSTARKREFKGHLKGGDTLVVPIVVGHVEGEFGNIIQNIYEYLPIYCASGSCRVEIQTDLYVRILRGGKPLAQKPESGNNNPLKD